MGVDYDAVGGIGIRVTDEVLDALGYKDERVEDFLDDRLANTSVSYIEFGSCYSKDSIEYALVVEATKYSEIVKSVPKFLEDLRNLGLNCSESDLVIISELYEW